MADGHGEFGKEVSNLIKTVLPRILLFILGFFQENLITLGPVEAFHKAYYQTNNVIVNGKLNVELSGSTCVSVMIDSGKLYTANVGDSRAIICSASRTEKIKGKAITRDHKPSEPDEARRIEQAGGRIGSFTGNYNAIIDTDGNPMGPSRVWQSEKNIPGLAMTRAMGEIGRASCRERVSSPG